MLGTAVAASVVMSPVFELLMLGLRRQCCCTIT